MRDMLYYYLMMVAGKIAAQTRSIHGTVFCFHSVTPNRVSIQRESELSVQATFIRLLIHGIRNLDVPIISIDEAVSHIGLSTRPPFAVFTFDDGYLDNYQTLFPLMEEENAPYTIFLTSNLINGTMPLWWDTIEKLVYGSDSIILDGENVLLPGNQKAKTLRQIGGLFKNMSLAGQRRLMDEMADANPQLRALKPYQSCMSWDMLRDMNASPLLTVGAHTQTHPMLSALTAEAVRGELTTSKEEIADQLGCAVEYLAYPYGTFDEYGAEAPIIAQQAGYRAAFTTCQGDWYGPEADLYALPRVQIANKASHPDIPLAYMSPWPRRVKSLARKIA